MFRTVIATVAAALVLAPASLVDAGAASGSSGDVLDDGYPRGTTLRPARLERGQATPLLHSEKEVIVDGDLRIPVSGVANYWMLGRVGRDYLLQTAGPDFMRYAVMLVRRDGSRRVLQRFGQRTTPVPSADGRRLALVTLDRPNTRIRVVRTRSGKLVREATFPSYGAEVSDYGDRRMVVTGVNSRTLWWDPVTGRRLLIVPRSASADIAANRLVVSIPHPTTQYEECVKLVELRRPTVELWRSCQDRPQFFSPDGRRMVTTSILADGLGPSVIQVRRVDGKVLRTYRPPSFFGFVEWETNHSLLLQPIGSRYAAAVRCFVGGECRRASRLYKGFGDNPEPLQSMRWTFP